MAGIEKRSASDSIWPWKVTKVVGDLFDAIVLASSGFNCSKPCCNSLVKRVLQVRIGGCTITNGLPRSRNRLQREGTLFTIFDIKMRENYLSIYTENHYKPPKEMLPIN